MSQTLKKLSESMLLKGIVIGILTLLMLIPINMVTNLISERYQYKQEVTEEITSKWGGSQKIVGPILIVPFKKHIETRHNGEVYTQTNIEYAYLLPDDYKLQSEIKVEERSRSIYNILVYQSDNLISGSFSPERINNLKIAAEDIVWEDTFVIIGIPHMQGIKNRITFNANGEDYAVVSGVPINTITRSGLTAKLPIHSKDIDKQINFRFNLVLNGSENLEVAPIGKENNIKMHADWNTVAFSGDFLPSNRNIDNNGFDAEWNILDYNRNYMQTWVGYNEEILPQTGINLKHGVDQYQMSMRSVKYAIMFIVLTFVIFFLVEIITKKRIHPVQYTLVSLGLLIFYTLLIALSEQINFHLAYFISALAIVLMITLYVKSIFKEWKPTFMMGAFVIGIYVYLYIILQLEDMSLLIGAVGLFAALAIIMYTTRKIDWYKKDSTEV